MHLFLYLITSHTKLVKRFTQYFLQVFQIMIEATLIIVKIHLHVLWDPMMQQPILFYICTIILLWVLHSQNYNYLAHTFFIFNFWFKLITFEYTLNTRLSTLLQDINILMMKPWGSRARFYVTVRVDKLREI